jgi:hypothetical protein
MQSPRGMVYTAHAQIKQGVCCSMKILQVASPVCSAYPVRSQGILDISVASVSGVLPSFKGHSHGKSF